MYVFKYVDRGLIQKYVYVFICVCTTGVDGRKNRNAPNKIFIFSVYSREYDFYSKVILKIHLINGNKSGINITFALIFFVRL